MLTFYDNGAEFAVECEQPWVANNAVFTGFFMSNIQQFDPTSSDFAVKYQTGDATILGIRHAGHPMFFAGADAAVEDFAHAMHRRGVNLKSIIAEKRLHDAFVKAWPVKETSRKDMRVMVYSTPTVTIGADVVRAGKEHVKDIAKLLEQFYRETGQVSEHDDYKQMAKEKLGRTYVILDGKQVVSMAMRARDFATTCCISGVVTDSAHRNKGFSKRVVGFLANQIHNEGKQCYLFADDKNMVARSLYTRLGFNTLKFYTQGTFYV